MTQTQETIPRAGTDKDTQRETLQLVQEIRERLAAVEHIVAGRPEDDTEGHTLTLTIDPAATGTPVLPRTTPVPDHVAQGDEHQGRLDRVQQRLLARKALRSLTLSEQEALAYIPHAQRALSEVERRQLERPEGEEHSAQS